jgi:hypothetical protein
MSLVYGGGKLLTNVEVVPIFFSNAWDQSQGSRDLMNGIVTFFRYILASSMMSLLGQYSTDSQQIRHGVCEDHRIISVNVFPGLVLQDSAIRDMLELWQKDGSIPRATVSTLYFLYLPLGVTFDGYGKDSCAYHSWQGSYQYSVVVYPGIDDDPCRLADSDNDLDILTASSSHELFEAITDPQGHSWHAPAPPKEICDLCEGEYGRHGPYYISYVWSNGQDGCVLASTFAGTTGTPYFPRAGDLTGAGHDQVMFLNRTYRSPGLGRVLVGDCSSGSPVKPAFLERWGDSQVLDGWEKAGDWHMVGDFLNRRHDQVMFLNRQRFGGRVMIGDCSSGPPMKRPYLENYGDSQLLDGWEKDGDWHLVGDFLHWGYDQVMFLNRQRFGGRVMIADFARGAPAQRAYIESWGDSPLLDGWEDDNDWCLVGDFLKLGYQQVMFLNRTEGGGRILIADFSKGPPAQRAYIESWGDSALLDGWEDDNDWCAAGDFLHLGYDQVMFLNRTQGGGRVLVADFQAGSPARPAFLERWGDSPLLDGWEKDNDWHLVGDFLHLGYDQVMFLNRQQFGGRIMIGDLSQGPPVRRAFIENWGDSPLLNGWEDDNDWYL